MQQLYQLLQNSPIALLKRPLSPLLHSSRT
jgi:hypothetical protein